jgi:hypothetical protein
MIKFKFITLKKHVAIFCISHFYQSPQSTPTILQPYSNHTPTILQLPSETHLLQRDFVAVHLHREPLSVGRVLLAKGRRRRRGDEGLGSLGLAKRRKKRHGRNIQ